jgi:phenylalanyl-tRNA synthetase beta chain
MYISLNWIRQYTDIKLSDEELISKIRSQIGEVEQVINYSDKYKGILIAKVLSKSDHPDADKLGVYQLDIGEEEVQVVAGDKTLEAGDTVAYFCPGSKVPYNANPEKHDGIIKKANLRGVESNGMMASARELNWGSNHSIVMRLETDAAPGEEFSKVYDLNDTIIDIENKALANRADCFGLIGIAREIAGIQSIEFTSPDWYNTTTRGLLPQYEASAPLNIENKGGELCPRYMAVTMSNIKISKSPDWLESLLIKSGVRPISNIVDITNYLMILTGQALHAFDYDKVLKKDITKPENVHLTIRSAQNGEKITTLDEKTHELDDTMLMICDSSAPIAVGGIMGGLDTEIDESTTRIIIECANFDKYNIRKTSMKLGIFSDAVTRFTKGQDPEKCEPILYEAIKLVSELTEGCISSDIYDSYEIPKQSIDINVSISKLNSHLGINLSSEEITQILNNVELFSTRSSDDLIIVQVPSYRGDLTIPEDIHEEVGRLYGYDNIQKSLPQRTIKPTKRNQRIALQSDIRKILVASGANEILTYNFQSLKQFSSYNQDPDKAFHLKNPLSPELEFMRTSMLPSVLEKVNGNIRSGYKSFALFEINKVHNKQEMEEGLPVERQNIAFSFTADEKTALTKYDGSPYYVAKTYAESLFEKLGTPQMNYELLSEESDLPFWIENIRNMYKQSASAVVSYKLEGKKYYLGVIGEIASNVIRKNKLPEFTSGFEISVDSLQNIYDFSRVYLEPSKYPHVNFDLCFIVDNDVPYMYIEELIMKQLHAEDLYVIVSPVDIYQSEIQSEDDLKQMTYRIKIQSKERTLDNDEVTEYIKRVSRYVLKETGGKLKED